MPQKFVETEIMSDHHSITLDDGARKHSYVDLRQYSGEYGAFCILSHGTQYSDERESTMLEHLIRDGKEAMIRAINLWNSVIMEKDYGHITAAEDDGVPF